MGISIYLGCGIRLFLHLNRQTISSNLRLLTSGCILRFYSLYVFSSYSLSLVLVHLSYFLHPLLCCFVLLNANSWTTPLLNVFLFPRFLTMAYALCPESMWYICLYFFFSYSISFVILFFLSSSFPLEVCVSLHMTGGRIMTLSFSFPPSSSSWSYASLFCIPLSCICRLSFNLHEKPKHFFSFSLFFYLGAWCLSSSF